MLHKQHRLGLLLWAAASTAAAQTDRLTFEVESVKALPTQGGRFTMQGGPGTSDPGRLRYANIPLRRVLLVAYDYRNYQITGPDWLDTLRYDITATMAAGTTHEQMQEMLRNLLATRFQMTVHREKKETAIYALLTGKNGPKIKPVRGDTAAGDPNQLAVVGGEGKDGFPKVTLPAPGLVIETKNGTARITSKDSPLAKVADMLTGQVGRPVIDMSELPGIYSFELYFAPEGPGGAESTEPRIFGAVQEQLGLRLEARKAPVEFLVIDHAEKMPTGN